MPEAFLIRVASEMNIDLPPRNHYAVGMTFLPQDAELRRSVKSLMDEARPLPPPPRLAHGGSST